MGLYHKANDINNERRATKDINLGLPSINSVATNIDLMFSSSGKLEHEAFLYKPKIKPTDP